MKVVLLPLSLLLIASLLAPPLTASGDPKKPETAPVAAVPAEEEVKDIVEQEFKPRIALGVDTISLEPSQRRLYVMASLQCPELEGVQRVNRNGVRLLRSADGATPSFYPRQLSFRVTASGKDGLLTTRAVPFDNEDDTEFLVRNLEFQLKAFDGLKYTTLEPVSVQSIGPPPDVPSEQRVYEVQFDVGELPIERRLVLEVLSPYGERMSRFNVYLY